MRIREGTQAHGLVCIPNLEVVETVDRVAGFGGWICKFEARSEILELDSRFRGIRKICGRWPGLKILLEAEFRDFGGRIRQIGGEVWD